MKNKCQKINHLLTRDTYTHDTRLLLNCLKRLKIHKFRSFSIPTFDKSTDNNLQKKMEKINKKPDVVIFEDGALL